MTWEEGPFLPTRESRTSRGPRPTPASEVDLHAAVEGAADIAVDRAARAGAGQAEGRLPVEQIVDADVEAEAVVDLRLEPDVAVEDLRVARRGGKVRILRRIALRAVGRLVAG